jgi:hypothetical protein
MRTFSQLKYQSSYMSQLTAAKKKRQKQSKFQKLWARVVSRKAENERFKANFDALFQRVQETINPVEYGAATAYQPLLHNLLILAQRKSLANWHREVLDGWIKEVLAYLAPYALVDSAMLEDIARYDAFRMDITLEDDSISPPSEQLIEILRLQQEEYEVAGEQQKEQREETFAERKTFACIQAERQVELLLDRQMGPAPELEIEADKNMDDFFQDSLEQENKNQHEAYKQERSRLREELLVEMLAQIDRDFEAEALDSELDDDFGTFEDFFESLESGFDEEHENNGKASSQPHAPKITNQVFQSMFRATAARLHPDREADPTLREAKQILMTNLLGARKKGDVMTVVEMYQQHVGGDTTFSKADEKELIAALEYQIAELENEKLDVIEQSPLHAEIHERFYSTSKKRVDDSIDKHLREVRRDKLEIEQQAGSIRSLKTLKPWLEKRYEEEMLDSPFGRFGQDFDFSRDWPF